MHSACVAVYGAYGHTGLLVSQELRRRGHRLVLIGRDPARMRALPVFDGERKLALPIDDPTWPAALDGVSVLVNCAGPFADTAMPLIETALQVGTNYIDTAGEPQVVRDVFTRFGDRARALGLVVAPAAGFYGALGDLLVAATAGDWSVVDRVELDFITDGWNPTRGTRAAAARLAGRRLVYDNWELREETGQPEFIARDYGEPFGVQSVMQGYPSPEAVLVPLHLATPSVAIGMGSLAILDLRNPALTGPRAGEASQQRFLVEARIHREAETRIGRCLGMDIYGITAPIVAGAVSAIAVNDKSRAGVLPLSQAVDSRGFLAALERSGLKTTIG